MRVKVRMRLRLREKERHPDWMMIGVHWKLLCLSGQDRDTLRALL
jgi:hypothetical protein